MTIREWNLAVTVADTPPIDDRRRMTCEVRGPGLSPCRPHRFMREERYDGDPTSASEESAAVGRLVGLTVADYIAWAVYQGN